MAAICHSREEYEALGRDVSAAQWAEGLAVFNPKREAAVRREKGKRISFREWPSDLAERFVNTMTHLKRKYGTPMAFDVACHRLEKAAPHPDEGEMETDGDR